MFTDLLMVSSALSKFFALFGNKATTNLKLTDKEQIHMFPFYH